MDGMIVLKRTPDHEKSTTGSSIPLAAPRPSRTTSTHRLASVKVRLAHSLALDTECLTSRQIRRTQLGNMVEKDLERVASLQPPQRSRHLSDRPKINVSRPLNSAEALLAYANASHHRKSSMPYQSGR